MLKRGLRHPRSASWCSPATEAPSKVPVLHPSNPTHLLLLDFSADWINVELLERDNSTLVVVNGQLDRVRGGYYNSFIFPKIGQVAERFYRKFEPIFCLKPLSDKGCGGWLYRVYPEPWQVVLQQKADGDGGFLAATFPERPTYADAIQALVQAARTRKA